ncbi:MAG: thiol:disulfide interchange protein DsbA/DsbL [Pseudohongiellaceae bacterium]
MKHALLRQLTLLLLIIPMAAAVNAQPTRYSAGTHYTELDSSVRTADPDKVEVLEVFWYGCNHCFRFQPLLESWNDNKADDVHFERFPAIWNGLMQVHAQAYYTAVSLDVVDQVHEEIFNAINLRGNRLMNENQLAELFSNNGVDEEAFREAFNSFSVRTRVNRTERLMSDYQIQSTPNVVVNGKYLVSTSQAVSSQQEMLDVVDFLVERERAEL